MKKILLFLLCFLLFSCENEYTQFHKAQLQTESMQQKNTPFSFDDIGILSGVTLKKTPDTNLIKEITKKIDAAQKRVYVEVYIFTLKDFATALKKAKKRGLEVKVILEKNVYLA